MRFSTLLTTTTALLVLVSIVPPKALARPGGDPLRRLEAAVGDAGLDPETEAGIYAILDAARSERQEGREDVRDAREALHALLEQDVPDEEEVFAQVEAIGALETERRKSGLETVLAVRSRLTADQWEAVREAMSDRGRFGGRGGPGCSER